ncbi:MAG: HD-GYP domain-containing protein, partial [bacterium]
HAILHHHERYDGNGYPANLDGERIPLWSRIIAVADALDAMISERYYQAPLRPKVALKRIEQESGKHFDPAIVKKIIKTQGLMMKTH